MAELAARIRSEIRAFVATLPRTREDWLRIARGLPGWLLFAVALAASIVSALHIQGYTFDYGNVAVSVPQVWALIDSDLFQKDICHQQVNESSPRIYVNGLMALTAGSNLGKVAGAYFFWFVVAIALYVFALGCIGKALGGRFAAAALAFLGLVVTRGTVGSVDLIHHTRHFEPATLAMGVAAWGIYCCLRSKWVLGYALFGVAALFQFLVGFLPGALIAPVLIWLAARERKLWPLLGPMIPFGIGLALVYVPMVISGATAATGVSDRDFVFLYAHVRNPHHVVPSAWGDPAWIELALFTLGGLGFILAPRGLSRLQKGTMLTVVAGTWIALGLNYYFVDVSPNAFIAKLQLARCTPFAKLMILAGVATIAAECFRSRRGGLALIFLLAPLDPFGSWVFVLAGLAALQAGLAGEEQPRGARVVLWLVAGAALYYFFAFDGRQLIFKGAGLERLVPPRLMGVPIFFALLAAPWIVSWLLGIARPVLRYGLAAVVALAALLVSLKIADPSPELRKYLTRRVVKGYSPHDARERLARMLPEKTPADALVLVPPGFDTFQFHSKRSAVVTFKCIPLSERGIVEWSQRLGEIFGTPVGVQTSWRGDLDGAFFKRNAADLFAVAKKHGARYLLTRAGSHGGVRAPVVAQDAGWAVYEVP